MIYRIKQFFLASTVKFRKLDLDYVDKYLNKEEKKEFLFLSKSEQFHCIRVSKDLKNTYEEDKDVNISDLIKLGLLHDLGKQGLNFGPIKKAIFVIIKKVRKGNLNKYSDFNPMKMYYNHPIKGVNILKKIKSSNYSDEFVEAIRLHHSNQNVILKSNNIYLKYLNLIDDRN